MNNIYLEDLMENFGELFDFVSNLEMDLDEFFEHFLSSKISNAIEQGSPKYCAGMSGEELFYEIIIDTKLEFVSKVNKSILLDYSKEYWAGYIFIYLKNALNMTFRDIHKYISIKEIVNSYYPLHEASEEKALDVFTKIIKERILKETNLQRIRKLNNLSQKQLSVKANINYRTLQEYESRKKDINKASGLTLLCLSKALNCSINDLFEISL